MQSAVIGALADDLRYYAGILFNNCEMVAKLYLFIIGWADKIDGRVPTSVAPNIQVSLKDIIFINIIEKNK